MVEREISGWWSDTIDITRKQKKLRLIATVWCCISLLVIKISPAQLPPRRNSAPSKSTPEDLKGWSNNIIMVVEQFLPDAQTKVH